MIHTYSIANDTASGVVVGFTLQKQIIAAGLTNLNHIETNEDALTIYFSQALDASQVTTLDGVVAAHTGKTSAEQIADYLALQVFPFVRDLINDFAAENITLGITQAGKTGHVLGLFSKPYPCPSITLPISLKNCFDTGSLYSARDVIQYVRNNPMEYAGLSPFITDARLLAMKNKIETFLGLPLST